MYKFVEVGYVHIIVLVMRQQIMRNQNILEVYGFLLMLVLGFRARFGPLQRIIFIWAFSKYLFCMHISDFELLDYPCPTIFQSAESWTLLGLTPDTIPSTSSIDCDWWQSSLSHRQHFLVTGISRA